MKTKRVVITGVGAVCAFGREWHEIEAAFRAGKNAVRRMEAWDAFPKWKPASAHRCPPTRRPHIGRANSCAAWARWRNTAPMPPNKR